MGLRTNYKNLACATVKEALKEYFEVDNQGKKSILKDLRSEWMDWFTNGLSIVAAQHLETNPWKIRKILKKYEEAEKNEPILLS